MTKPKKSDVISLVVSLSILMILYFGFISEQPMFNEQMHDIVDVEGIGGMCRYIDGWHDAIYDGCNPHHNDFSRMLTQQMEQERLGSVLNE